MDSTRFVYDARARMRAHGIFIQGVVPSLPTDPTYCYSVGMQRLRVPRPEVILFGSCPACLGSVLSAVYGRVRTSGPLPVGEELCGLFPGHPRWPVRVERVLPEWVEAYAGMVGTVLCERSRDVPMLQLVLPDDNGRWPEDPAAEMAMLAGQPLLARTSPWLVPIVHTPEKDLFPRDAPQPTVPLAVPVDPLIGSGARHEVLRSRPLADGAVRIAEVPWVADHVAVGDVVAVREPVGVPGLPAGARVMGGLLQAGGWSTRTFRLPGPDVAPARVADLVNRLWDLVDAGRARMATTTKSLHVNTPDPQDFETAVRPFVRDGVLVPRAPRSEPDGEFVTIDDCPDCQAWAGGCC